MLLLIAPFSSRHAAYTAGRYENARVKFGRWPKISLSVAYISAVAPSASSSGTVSTNVIGAPVSRCASPPCGLRTGSQPWVVRATPAPEPPQLDRRCAASRAATGYHPRLAPVDAVAMTHGL